MNWPPSSIPLNDAPLLSATSKAIDVKVWYVTIGVYHVLVLTLKSTAVYCCCMSVQVDTDGVSYSDHEKQIIAANLVVDTGEEADTFTDIEPVGERGLDPNEVAELVSLRRIAVIAAGESEGALGINSTSEESPTNAPSNLQTGKRLTIESGNLPEEDTFLSSYEALESLDSYVLGQEPQETGRAVTEREVNFQEMYGEGPYVDTNDKLGLHFEAENNSGTKTTYPLIYELVWRVEESAESIPRFSRPRPR